MKSLYLLILAASLSLSAGFASAQRNLPMQDSRPFGAQLVWPSETNYSPLADELALAQIQWTRLEACWWSIAETQPGVFDFNPNPSAWPDGRPWLTDQALDILEQKGIEPYVVLNYTNPIYEPANPPRGQDWIEAYAEYCYQLATRYKDQVDYYEIWNEPNLSFFWGFTPNPQVYTQMAIRAAERVREADPGAYIIGGSVSGIDQGFLNQCFQNGLLNAVDAISVHPYRIDRPESIEAEIASLHSTMSLYTNREIDIITGEWGYNTCWSEIDEQGQAKALSRMMVNNMALDIELSIWFSTHSFTEVCGPFDPSDDEWALIRRDNTTRRPSMEAFDVLNQIYRAPMSTREDIDITVTFEPADTRTLVTQIGEDELVIAIWRATWPIVEGESMFNRDVIFFLDEDAKFSAINGLDGSAIDLEVERNGQAVSVANFPVADHPNFIRVELQQPIPLLAGDMWIFR